MNGLSFDIQAPNAEISCSRFPALRSAFGRPTHCNDLSPPRISMTNSTGGLRLLAWITLIMLAIAPSTLNAQPKISEFTLDNGLQVVVIPDHRAPVVTHMIWYKVGAADEPKGVSGIAHFLEHLMFKSTEKIPL